MSHIYVTDSACKLGLRQNQLVIENSCAGTRRCIPLSSVDDISVFGMPQITTQLIRACISRDISICFYSDDGHYFGNVSSSSHVEPWRQKRQVYLTDDQAFCLAWSKRIVFAKIMNSITLLGSFPDVCTFSGDELAGLVHSLRNVESAESVNAVMGYEGNAAKNYFACLPKLLVNEDFAFRGRSARPPRDAFNSMISYGYSLLYRDIIGGIERRGLHPYFAFMHKLRFGHAALASDLVEEYRAPIVDRAAVSMVNEGLVSKEGFYINEAGAVYMTRETQTAFTKRMAGILSKGEQYFKEAGDSKSYAFQAMLDRKLDLVIKAIELGDARCYVPYVWSPR